MYRFSTVANVLAKLSRFLLLESMEQIKPDNPKEICCNRCRRLRFFFFCWRLPKIFRTRECDAPVDFFFAIILATLVVDLFLLLVRGCDARSGLWYPTNVPLFAAVC